MGLFSTALSFAAGAGATWGLSKLREDKREQEGLSDLLNWAAAIDPGIIRQKDGSYLAGFKYRGPDLSSATAAEVDALTRKVNDALLGYTDGWCFHFKAVRAPATSYAKEGHFESRVARRIDEERRQEYESGQKYETQCYLTASYLPPDEAQRKIEQYLIKNAARHDADWEAFLGQYKRALDALEDRLSTLLDIERLDTPGLLSLLYLSLTGDHQPINTRAGEHLGHSLATNALIGGMNLQIKGRHLRPIAIRGFPTESHSGFTDFLNEIAFEYQYTIRWLPLSQKAADKEIKDHKHKWYRKVKPAWQVVGEAIKNEPKEPKGDEPWVNKHAFERFEETPLALKENASRGATFGYFTATIFVYDEDEARVEHKARTIIKELADHGLTGEVEKINAVESYLGTQPGHVKENLRRILMSSRNAVDFFPFTLPWGGHKTNPSPFFAEDAPPLLYAKTAGSTPFRLSLGHSDVKHTLILGGTSGGKSVLVGLITAQWMRYKNAKTFVFDVGRSHEMLCRAVGGHHYDVGSEGGLTMQPLRYIDSKKERDWAKGWLEMIYKLNDQKGRSLTPSESNELSKALRLLAEGPPAERTLTDLTYAIGDKDMRSVLEKYKGDFLDGNSDPIGEGNHHVFEIASLIEKEDKILLPALYYLFHRTERAMDGSPVLIPIEEAWAALKHPDFARKMEEWLLTLRKKNAAVMPVMHSPSQFTEDRMRGAKIMIESCRAHIFLPNPTANASPDNRANYRQFGLSDPEIDIIAEATEKRDYYYKTLDGSRLLQLDLEDSIALSFLGTSDHMTIDQQLAQAADLQEEYGDEWTDVWINRKTSTTT